MITLYWVKTETDDNGDDYSVEVSRDIEVDDNSYRYRALMEKPQLILKFYLSEYIDIPIGAWCEFQNEKFVLGQPANLKKSGERNIEYNLTLGQDEDKLGLYKLHNSVDHRLKFSLCAKPHEFIEEIVANLNEREGSEVWSVGDCLDASEKTVEFNHSYIDDALQSIADTFETEWEIADHVIYLRKVEYYKDDPLPLSYGKGNGFVPGVGRTTESDAKPIKRMYAQGGDRNIDRSKYGGVDADGNYKNANFPYKLSSAELLLPSSQTLEYEGRTYQSDAEGYYIERVDKVSDAVKEDSLDCSDIYPSRVGTVSSVEVADADNNFYDIIDSSIPEALNFNDYVIEGETPTIIFQSGMLAGDDKEFEFKYKHSERRFELVPQEIDGVTMPNETYKPAEGDTYAVFGIMLPDEYICNNEDKTGASWDMFRECARSLYENEDQKFTFSGELQGLWAKRNWLTVGGRLKVGGYILFSDTQFAPDGMSIRITGIKDYVNSPYSPTLEISNSVSGKSVSSQLKEIDNQEVIISETEKKIISFTKRRFRDALETIEMLDSSLLNFSESVNPVAVQTMAALIGDESLQFRFVSSLEDLTPVSYAITYDQENKQLSCPHGYLQHMTLGISSISSSHGSSEYKVWEMAEYLSPVLTDGTKKYYLYAKVSSTDTTEKGEFTLSETAIAMDDVEGYYYLLVGVLNSENDDERSYVSLYGFTEILPGRITTDRIVSTDGISFLDLLNNALHLGGSEAYLDWNNEELATLIMSNATVKDALKVLGKALIAGFYFSDEVINSSKTVDDDPAMYLNGKTGKIHLQSSYTGGDYSLDSSTKSEIDLDAASGVVKAKNSNGVAYLSASGVFCNNAQTNALPASSGYTHYGSVVGLGFGDVDYAWEWDKESSIIAGVYGRADNDGTARAYGGYFWDLLAAGLILRQKYIGDSAATTAVTLGQGYSQVVGLTNSGKQATVYLPSDGYEGRVIWAKQIGAGSMRFYPKSGQSIYDDTSENDYYDVETGYEAKFTFAKYSINSVSTEVWLVSRWKF